MVPGPFPQPLLHIAKFGGAVVRVVALVVVALAVVVPLVVVLTVALFRKKKSQKYAKSVLKTTVRLFKAVLDTDRRS